MEETVKNLTPEKWLKYLFYVHIAGLLVSILGLLGLGDLNQWISLAFSAVTVLCLYKMGPLQHRYEKAALFTGLTVILSLFASLPAAVFSLMATYQEYNGHSELVAEQDLKLSSRWHGLFGWQLLVGILSAVASTAATVILVLAEMEESAIVDLVVAGVQVVYRVVDLVYLRYLYQTDKILNPK